MLRGPGGAGVVEFGRGSPGLSEDDVLLWSHNRSIPFAHDTKYSIEGFVIYVFRWLLGFLGFGPTPPTFSIGPIMIGIFQCTGSILLIEPVRGKMPHIIGSTEYVGYLASTPINI
jgi:hypothetical protein